MTLSIITERAERVSKTMKNPQTQKLREIPIANSKPCGEAAVLELGIWNFPEA
jgi:hypothetical protein